jgi:NAD(P)-dependent dehydrogenase (short-subunit alcohol dehydrogenase family)
MKTAVITGGGQGIGRIIARDLLNKEYKVSIFEIDREAGRETEEEFQLPDRFLFLETDISKENQVKNSILQTIRVFGSLDILVNNAAISINKRSLLFQISFNIDTDESCYSETLINS